MRAFNIARCGVATAPQRALFLLRPVTTALSSSTSPSSMIVQTSNSAAASVVSRPARLPRSASSTRRLRCRASVEASTPNSLNVRLSPPGLDKSSPTVVYKFGGSSVADATRMREVADIVCSFPEHLPVIVLSAMGKVSNGRWNVLGEDILGGELRGGRKERTRKKNRQPKLEEKKSHLILS